MIVTLPKNYANTCDVPLFSADEPVWKLTPVTDGVLLYELKNNSLIGQIFFEPDEGSATVSIAEGRSFVVKKQDKICLIEGEGIRFVVFGNCNKYEYTVFEYSDKSVEPASAIRVTTNPAQGYFYDACIDDNTNLLRAVLILAAINGLVQQ